MDTCYICQKIEAIKQHKNFYFVKEMPTGYVVLEEYQYYQGYVIFISKYHKDELQELPQPERLAFLYDMSCVAEAVQNAFSPVRLNIEKLGNTVSHLHWHIIPRYKSDRNPLKPIWMTPERIRRKDEAEKETVMIIKEQLIPYL